MPIRYDSVLLAALAGELAGKYTGGLLRWIVFDQSAMTVRLATAERGSILFALGPEAGAIVSDPATGPAPARRHVRLWQDLEIGTIETPFDSRMLVLRLRPRTEEARARHLVVELQTNGWNGLIVGEGSGRIEELLRPRDTGGRQLRRGAEYVPLRQDRLWADDPPAFDVWVDGIADLDSDGRRADALGRIAFLSTINVDWVLGTGDDPQPPEASYRRYMELRSADELGAWLLARRLGPQPYPRSLGEASARACPSILDAMAASRTSAPDPSNTPTSVEEAPEAAELRRLLDRARVRHRKRAEALARELESTGDSSELRSAAQLVLARKETLRRGLSEVVLTGFDGVEIKVALDPLLDPVENANRMFDEARRRERARTRIPALVEQALADTRKFDQALESLDEDGPSAELWTLIGGRRGTAARPGQSDRASLPFRTLRSTSGLEIRVGRGARANDDLTLRHSSPEDIWLHARQSPGAHVILRWGRRDQNPPHSDLVEAAMVAALNSDARHSGVVAVDWTRRKYVRKPRKAAPGAVIPERVKTLFVEPDAELVSRLSGST